MSAIDTHPKDTPLSTTPEQEVAIFREKSPAAGNSLTHFSLIKTSQSPSAANAYKKISVTQMRVSTATKLSRSALNALNATAKTYGDF